MLKLKMARSEKAYSFTVKQDLNWCWGNDQAIKAMDAKKNEKSIIHVYIIPSFSIQNTHIEHVWKRSCKSIGISNNKQ